MAKLWRSVWSAGGSKNTYHRKLWVVKLALGEDVVFTGRTVLWLRQIITATPDAIDILLGPGTGQRARNGVRFFRGAPFDSDATVSIEGFRTASVYRSVSDVAAVVPMESLMRWIPAMDRRRLGNLAGLKEHMTARGRFVGAVNLRAAIVSLERDLPHSGAERLARRSLRDAGMQPARRPHAVKHSSRTLAEIDIAFVDVKYGAEIDGPHHQLPEVVAADKQRDRQLRRLGWTIDRFTVAEVEANPEAFVAAVQQGLADAQRREFGVTHR